MTQHPPLVLYVASAMWRACGHKKKLSASFAQAANFISMAEAALECENQWSAGLIDETELDRLMAEFNSGKES